MGFVVLVFKYLDKKCNGSSRLSLYKVMNISVMIILLMVTKLYSTSVCGCGATNLSIHQYQSFMGHGHITTLVIIIVIISYYSDDMPIVRVVNSCKLRA